MLRLLVLCLAPLAQCFILDEAVQLQDYMQTVRRHLHKWPELSYNEHKTSAYIQAQLKQMGIKDVQVVAGTGLSAFLGACTCSRNLGVLWEILQGPGSTAQLSTTPPTYVYI